MLSGNTENMKENLLSRNFDPNFDPPKKTTVQDEGPARRFWEPARAPLFTVGLPAFNDQNHQVTQSFMGFLQKSWLQ